ncbi:hypothetical protein DFH09DRAFT_1480501 [Mycena vulgaris]|nr:hypothetical protein DFH09DRAFT_1480501 [Mycena vulgaris]
MGSPGDGLPGPGGRLQSPFSRLLCTNTVPSDAECAAIRQFLSGLQKNFAALAGQIAHMQAVLTDLTDQCQSLRESIDAHQALVSLARRLPEDVVREIFLACLPSSGNAVMSAREAPLLLGQVLQQLAENRVYDSAALGFAPCRGAQSFQPSPDDGRRRRVALTFRRSASLHHVGGLSRMRARVRQCCYDD